MKKNKEAANRDIDIQATLKRGNLIIQFSSAAFLQFNTCFDQYFSSKQSLKLTVHESSIYQRNYQRDQFHLLTLVIRQNNSIG